MATVTSKDGTRIAFDRAGNGPAVILVDGALCYRASGPMGPKGQPLPAGRWSKVAAPTAVVDGGKSPTWMRNATRALAKAVPGATYHTLPGQTHMVQAKALGPMLLKLFQKRSVIEAA